MIVLLKTEIEFDCICLFLRCKYGILWLIETKFNFMLNLIMNTVQQVKKNILALNLSAQKLNLIENIIELRKNIQ